MNGWNYGDDNPVNRIDPSGRFSAVAITNGRYNQPTVAGLDRTELAFSTMADHLGWISLLLDADESQYVYNWSNLTHREPYGKLKCDEDGHSITRVNEPYTAWRTATEATLFNTNKIPRPRPELGRWWRDNGVYSLVNGSEEKFYFDKGDDGHTSDLPDFMVLTGGSVGLFWKNIISVNGAAIQDRYGRLYAQGGGSFSASLVPFSWFLGEGYVYHGSIWDIKTDYIVNEKELENAIRGGAFSIGGGLIIGPVLNINACAARWDRGPCYGSVIFTTGLIFNADVGGGGVFQPAQSKPDEAWDWMLSKPGPSRAEVWQRWLKSAVDNPCGECSAAK